MKKTLFASAVVGALFSSPAHAVDGCKVLLCLAGDWSHIAECRPEVERAMRDVALGRSWPTCSMGGSSSASFQWANESTCPAFYSLWNVDTGNWAGCTYPAIVSVRVNGAAWSDLFWSFSDGPMSTRYYSPARAALGSTLDPRYDTDAAAYVPPPPSGCMSGGSGDSSC